MHKLNYVLIVNYYIGTDMEYSYVFLLFHLCEENKQNTMIICDEKKMHNWIIIKYKYLLMFLYDNSRLTFTDLNSANWMHKLNYVLIVNYYIGTDMKYSYVFLLFHSCEENKQNTMIIVCDKKSMHNWIIIKYKYLLMFFIW